MKSIASSNAAVRFYANRESESDQAAVLHLKVLVKRRLLS